MMTDTTQNASLMFEWTSDGLGVICSGWLDSQTPEVDCDRAMNGLRLDDPYAPEGKPRVTVQLDQIELFNTSGVCWLILLQDQIRKQGFAMRVVGATPKLRGVLRILEVDQDFEMDRIGASLAAHHAAAEPTS